MKYPNVPFIACVLLGLSSCAYIIPPEQNAPRHNTVLGEPRKPELNGRPVAPSGTPTSAIAAPVVPVARNDMPALPPVDPSVAAQAAKEITSQQPTAVATTQSAAAVSYGAANGRRVPLENAAFQMAGGSYPNLNSVPPRPVMEGPGSVKERLSETQSDLVKSRADAENAKQALDRDAAAEPSMLAPLPGNDAPVPAIVPQPATAAPVTPTSQVVVPNRESVRRAPMDNMKPLAAVTPAPVMAAANPQPVVADAPSATMPNTPNFAPPAPMRGTMHMTTPVAALPTLRPITLTEPSASSPVIVAQELSAPVAMASAKGPIVRQGDFDPLAVADNAPIAKASPVIVTYGAAPARSGTGYMASSRYAERR